MDGPALARWLRLKRSSRCLRRCDGRDAPAPTALLAQRLRVCAVSRGICGGDIGVTPTRPIVQHA